MNDAVIFTMLYAQHLTVLGYNVNCHPDQMSMVSRLYDDFCEHFYRGTRWEYDTPDYTEMVLGMTKYIQERV